MNKQLISFLILTVGLVATGCKGMPDYYYSSHKSSSSMPSYSPSSSIKSSSIISSSELSSVTPEPDPSGPTIEIKDPLVYPSEFASAYRGQTVNLRNYLLSEQLEYFVTFKYTFDGYGDMGTGSLGAQPLHIEEPVSIDGWKMQLKYCGTYKVYFSANKNGERLNKEGDFFLLESLDLSIPSITNDSGVYTVNGDGSEAEPILSVISCEDTYFKALTKTLLTIDGSDYVPGKSYSDGKEHVVEVAVDDGFLNYTTKSIRIKFNSCIYQDKNNLKKIGKPYYHNFDDYEGLGSEYVASYNAGTYLGKDDAIDGNSMKFTNGTVGEDKCTVEWSKCALPLVQGSYEFTFDYKILSTKMPNYFCVGFYSGSVQKNKDNIFNGVTKKSGTITVTISIATAGNYFVHIFQYLADGSIIVFDNIIITRIS